MREPRHRTTTLPARRRCSHPRGPRLTPWVIRFAELCAQASTDGRSRRQQAELFAELLAKAPHGRARAPRRTCHMRRTCHIRRACHIWITCHIRRTCGVQPAHLARRGRLMPKRLILEGRWMSVDVQLECSGRRCEESPCPCRQTHRSFNRSMHSSRPSLKPGDVAGCCRNRRCRGRRL